MVRNLVLFFDQYIASSFAARHFWTAATPAHSSSRVERPLILADNESDTPKPTPQVHCRFCLGQRRMSKAGAMSTTPSYPIPLTGRFGPDACARPALLLLLPLWVLTGSDQLTCSTLAVEQEQWRREC